MIWIKLWKATYKKEIPGLGPCLEPFKVTFVYGAAEMEGLGSNYGSIKAARIATDKKYGDYVTKSFNHSRAQPARTGPQLPLHTDGMANTI